MSLDPEETVGCSVSCAGLLLWLAWVGLILWVAFHFISKYW